MKQLLLVLFFLGCVLSTLAQNQQTAPDMGDARKRKDIEKLLELQYTRNPDLAGVYKVVNHLRKTYPNVPEAQWESCKKGFTMQQYITLALPLMDKHYDHNNIRDLIEFYSLGKDKPKRMTQTMVMHGINYENEYYPLLAKKIEAILRQRGYRPQVAKPATPATTNPAPR
jgi:hypothetical protein